MKSIDYGNGKVNINSNGYRYGVIAIRSLHEWIYEQLEPVYPEPELDDEGNEIEDDYMEHIGQTLDKHGYKAHSAFDESCLFLTESPYFTYTDLCSPCAPGAGNLDSPSNEGARTLCFGHDMFNDERAPYPVYSVKTGKLIE
jgi:hypothetical protein